MSEPPSRPAACDSLPVVALREVGKRYRMRRHRPLVAHAVARRLAGRGVPREETWSLQDVSFEIRAGESVGVVGHNGAGKSTLLALIVGTTTPTRGAIEVRGRVGALLELAAGFHPLLTGRENIYLNASLLGLSRREIDARYEAIVRFSGLEEFIDAPLRSYSSGMQVRLGFAVTVHTDVDLLAVDEVLAVGDQDFQGRCLDHIADFKARNGTLLFVSHDLALVRRVCRRAIWLEHGRVRRDGPAEEVLAVYAAAGGGHEG